MYNTDPECIAVLDRIIRVGDVWTVFVHDTAWDVRVTRITKRGLQWMVHYRVNTEEGPWTISKVVADAFVERYTRKEDEMNEPEIEVGDTWVGGMYDLPVRITKIEDGRVSYEPHGHNNFETMWSWEKYFRNHYKPVEGMTFDPQVLRVGEHILRVGDVWYRDLEVNPFAVTIDELYLDTQGRWKVEFSREDEYGDLELQCTADYFVNLYSIDDPTEEVPDQRFFVKMHGKYVIQTPGGFVLRNAPLPERDFGHCKDAEELIAALPEPLRDHCAIIERITVVEDKEVLSMAGKNSTEAKESSGNSEFRVGDIWFDRLYPETTVEITFLGHLDGELGSVGYRRDGLNYTCSPEGFRLSYAFLVRPFK